MAHQERRDRTRECQHNNDGNDHRDHHHRDVLRHPHCRDYRVEREHDVQEQNLYEHDSECCSTRRRLVPLVDDLEVLVDLACRLHEQEQTSNQQNEISTGESLAENRKELGREAHHPGDCEQQPQTEQEGQREAKLSRRLLPAGGKLVDQNRNEDQVVDAEDDLHRRQRDQTEPGGWLGEKFHRLSSVASLRRHWLGGGQRGVLFVETLQLLEQCWMQFP